MLSTDKVVTVLLPVYNQVDFIEQAINSVLQQTIIDKIQLMIFDDNSQDGSSEIIDRFKVEYPDTIQVFRNSKNLGWIGNHNFAMSKVVTPYFLFNNGDDFFDPDYVEVLYDYVVQEPLLDAVFCGYKIVSDSGKTYRVSFPNTSVGKLRHIGSRAILFRRSFIIEQQLAFPDLRSGADCPFIEQIVQNGNATCIKFFGYNNRLQSESISYQENQNYREYFLNSLELIRVFSNNDKWRNKYSRYVISCFIITGYLLRIVEYLDALEFRMYLDQTLKEIESAYGLPLRYTFIFQGFLAHYKTGVFMLFFTIFIKMKLSFLLYRWFLLGSKFLKS
jgi:glycosyltransferase involved in cell wall biosynthesis